MKRAPGAAVKKPTPPARRRWLTLALRGLGAFVGLGVACVLVLRFVDPPTTAFMLQHRLESGKPNKQQWVPLEAISPTLQLAVVASEDQKFPQHFGFDVEAIADAVEDRFEGRSTRGASTLTQQVAKNLFLWPGQSFVRKGFEAALTVLLEVLWSKHRILEVHLNVAEFGEGVYGVEAACRAYYGKSAKHVTPEEAAMLAAVLPAPKKRSVKKPSDAMKARAGWVVEQLRVLGPHWLDDVR